MAPRTAPVGELRSSFAFFVVSCDAYSDLWNPYFQLFYRLWPDCPLRVLLLSNHLRPDRPEVESLRVGHDVSWSDNLRLALDRVDEPYIVLAIEDQFFCGHVDSTAVNAVLAWVLDHEPNYVRLLPTPRPDGPYDDLVGVVSRGTVYRASTVYCVWKKTALVGLLRSGEDAWEFEIKGGERADALDDFYSVWKPCFPVSHGVIRGRWLPGELRRLRRLGAEIDPARRPVMTPLQVAAFRLAQLRSRLLRVAPAGWGRRLRSLVAG